MKDLDEIKAKITEACLRNMPRDLLYFLCTAEGLWYFTKCKEVALHHSCKIVTEELLIAKIGNKDGELQKTILEYLTKLSTQFKINLKFESFEVEEPHNKGQVGHYINVTGWYNKNKLTREIFRTIVRSIYQHIIQQSDPRLLLEYFGTKNYLNIYCTDHRYDKARGLFPAFWSNLKESCDQCTDMKKLTRNGIVRWLEYGEIKPITSLKA